MCMYNTYIFNLKTTTCSVLKNTSMHSSTVVIALVLLVCITVEPNKES